MIHKRENSLSVCVQKQQEERYLRNQRELIKKQFLNDQRIEKWKKETLKKKRLMNKQQFMLSWSP